MTGRQSFRSPVLYSDIWVFKCLLLICCSVLDAVVCNMTKPVHQCSEKKFDAQVPTAKKFRLRHRNF